MQLNGDMSRVGSGRVGLTWAMITLKKTSETSVLLALPFFASINQSINRSFKEEDRRELKQMTGISMDEAHMHLQLLGHLVCVQGQDANPCMAHERDAPHKCSKDGK